MAFLLTGTALSLSATNIFQTGVDRLSDAVTTTSLVFETNSHAQHRVGATKVAIVRRQTDAPLILSGLPSYASAQFGLPISARPLSGYLKLDTTLQTLKGAEGILRVSIDNTRRGEILLLPGTVVRSLTIPLTPSDLSKPAVTVSFSLLGDGSTESCSGQEDLVVVAEIEASSQLILTLDAPLETAADRVIAWGNVAHVAWTEELTNEQRTDRLAQAVMLARTGMPIVFGGPEGLDEDGLKQVVAARLDSTPKASGPFPFPAAISQLGGNGGARTFKHSTVWRSRFELQGGAAGETAGQFDVDLRLGPLPVGARWTVSTTLNGKLLLAETLASDAREFKSTLDLSQHPQGQTNVLDVTATSDQNLPGLCNDGPDLIAEMTDATTLHGSGQTLSGALDSLRTALQNQTDLMLGALPPLSGAEAAAFAHIIGTAIPERIAVRGINAPADIILLRRADVATLESSGIATPEDWIVYAVGDDGALQAKLATPEALTGLSSVPPLAILIRIQPNHVAEAVQ
jgi:hypothetical protein